MEQNPDGNQNQSQKEQSGKNEKGQNAYVRVRGPRQYEVVDPEGYKRDSAICCQNHTNQTDRVLAQIVSHLAQSLIVFRGLMLGPYNSLDFSVFP